MDRNSEILKKLENGLKDKTIKISEVEKIFKRKKRISVKLSNQVRGIPNDHATIKVFKGKKIIAEIETRIERELTGTHKDNKPEWDSVVYLKCSHKSHNVKLI